MAKGDGFGIGIVLMYLFIALINIAWIGTLIWAIIYALTHMDQWLG